MDDVSLAGLGKDEQRDAGRHAEPLLLLKLNEPKSLVHLKVQCGFFLRLFLTHANVSHSFCM